MECQERERIARANAERIAFLYSRLFGNVAPGRDVAQLRTESQASNMFLRARGENRRQVEILRVAIDNRWDSVVNAFIAVWDDEHPIADTVQELWTLIVATGRSAV